METWPEIPSDVVTWFRGVFAEANRRVCERLVNVPNIRETSLDDGLIEALVPDTAPLLLPSGAIVRMDTHNIGGLRRLGRMHWDLPYRHRWETADIAILVFIYRGEDLFVKKIGLLQSKRLYPENNDVEEDDDISFLQGMNSFIRRDPTQALGALHRHFVFNQKCVYGAIRPHSDQTEAINKLNDRFGPVVYYLLYNPHILPLAVSYPVHERIRVDKISLGCQVLQAEGVHDLLSTLSDGHPVSFEKMRELFSSGWPLEVWAADMLLTCRVGQQFDDSRDADVRYMLERRSGPIGAALAVSIVLPET